MTLIAQMPLSNYDDNGNASRLPGGNDLKRIDLASLLAASVNISMFAEKLLIQTRKLGERGLAELAADRTVAVFMRSLASILDTAKWLELPVTTATCERCHQLVRQWRPSDRILVGRQLGEQIAVSCHQIATSLGDEIGRHHTYIVGPTEGKLIDDGIKLFGLDIVNRFPEIRADVSDGAKCRAYELWTACVMHMMRVAEVGVGALADHLGVKRGATWGGTIANTTDALRDAARMKGDPEMRTWASETGTYLNFVKDAFRNPAMHPERSFSADEAVVIYDNTRAFMRMLVQRLT
ncbi:hypothetical protein [Inquilinus limosus]|uniref:hypothetical protein n=1 Tax=Inquilinus limosus TaxID=171674 RepID=UPI0012DC1C2E|nr:hypothetical protein [Inquilinus limosus]